MGDATVIWMKTSDTRCALMQLNADGRGVTTIYSRPARRLIENCCGKGILGPSNGACICVCAGPVVIDIKNFAQGAWPVEDILRRRRGKPHVCGHTRV